MGGAAWITDKYGLPVQYIMYAPYGEQLLNQQAGTYDERFKFTGKERDQETGYDYFGARYREPNFLNDFISVDPLADKFIDKTPYLYCDGNPIKFVDKNGLDITLAGANNSSVTIRTDLIDVSVNISKLNIDFGGTYDFQGDEILSAALDIVGIFDPSGIADGLNAALQWNNGDKGGAITSAIGLIPYAGDFAKAGKVKKDLGVINTAIEAVQSKGTQKTLSQLQKEIYIGKAPKGITRLDKGNPKNNEQPHVHFKDGSALNKDGTWKHGKGKLTNEQKQYLKQNGWNIE